MRRTTKNSSLMWTLKLLRSGFLCYFLAIGFSPLHAEDTVGLPSINQQHQEFLDSVEETRQATITSERNQRNAPTTAVSGGHGAATSTPVENIDANGDGKANEIKVEGNDLKATSKFLFSNIALFASGFFAPTLIKACPKTPSVWIFAGSALLYVANEIGLFTGFNKAINREMVAYLGRGDEDRQIDSLEAASKQTREAQKAAKKRAMISKITAAGFAAASAMAFAERADLFGLTGCKPAADAYFNPQPKNLLLINPQRFAMAEYYFSQQPMERFVSELSNDISLYPSQPTPHFKENGLGQKMMNYLIGNTYAQVGTDKDAKIVEDKDGDKSIVVNSVGAKLAATGLGVAGGLAVMKYAKTAGPAVKKFVKEPITRGIGFGVFSATAFMAAKESEEAAQKLDTRAKEYDRLADSLRSQTSQDIGLETGATHSLIDGSIQGIDNGSNKGISNNDACFTGGAGQIVVDSNCSCSQNNSCKKPEIPNLTKLPDFGGQSLLSDSMKSLSAAGSNLYSGRLKAGSTEGNKLVNSAARITKLRDALKDKINKDRLAKGNDAIDFAKAEKGMEGFLKRELDGAFNRLTPAEQRTLANLSGGIGRGSDDDANEEKEDKEGEGTGSGATAVAATDINPNPGKANANADGGTWDFDFGEEAQGSAEQDAMAQALEAEEDQDYVVKGDINDDRHKNLFNIITRRYLKSAYPVIFEEK